MRNKSLLFVAAWIGLGLSPVPAAASCGDACASSALSMTSFWFFRAPLLSTDGARKTQLIRTVTVICYANLNRSVALAAALEAAFRKADLKIQVVSAGIGYWKNKNLETIRQKAIEEFFPDWYRDDSGRLIRALISPIGDAKLILTKKGESSAHLSYVEIPDIYEHYDEDVWSKKLEEILLPLNPASQARYRDQFKILIQNFRAMDAKYKKRINVDYRKGLHEKKEQGPVATANVMTASLASDSNFVIVVDEKVETLVQRYFPSVLRKLFRFNLTDPARPPKGMTAEAARQLMNEEIEKSLPDLIRRITRVSA
jgi:hypothetical protein